MRTDNLHSLKDDMVAFISGLGLRRIRGYVTEDIPTVLVENHGPDAWKDFVENAKASGAALLTMSEAVLEKDEVLSLLAEMHEQVFEGAEAELDEAENLLHHVGKTGFLQLGFPHQGVMFLFEVETEWYEIYESLQESVYALNGLLTDGHDCDCNE
ncbi:MAG: hypothetical protein FWD64_11495 [Acidobacteriaceae bacterium]|nr:hypothetical protein [Acidobacteriaceae bacterium]